MENNDEEFLPEPPAIKYGMYGRTKLSYSKFYLQVSKADIAVPESDAEIEILRAQKARCEMFAGKCLATIVDAQQHIELAKANTERNNELWMECQKILDELNARIAALENTNTK